MRAAIVKEGFVMVLTELTTSLSSLEGGEKGLTTSNLDDGKEINNNGPVDDKKPSVYEVTDEILAKLDKLKLMMETNENEMNDRVNKLVKRLNKVEEIMKK